MAANTKCVAAAENNIFLKMFLCSPLRLTVKIQTCETFIEELSERCTKLDSERESTKIDFTQFFEDLKTQSKEIKETLAKLNEVISDART